MFSQSRIRTILEAARRCASDANPDRSERLRRLDAQIHELTAERDRIAAGGEISGVPDDRILEEYLNLRDLIGQLPADFLRVSEAVKAIQRVISGEFRAEGSRAGQILYLYLERSADLVGLDIRVAPGRRGPDRDRAAAHPGPRSRPRHHLPG
jgi:hypothetical protein